jgi:hypothetical protein
MGNEIIKTFPLGIHLLMVITTCTTIIDILGIIHPVFLNVLETGSCLCLQVKASSVGPNQYSYLQTPEPIQGRTEHNILNKKQDNR